MWLFKASALYWWLILKVWSVKPLRTFSHKFLPRQISPSFTYTINIRTFMQDIVFITIKLHLAEFSLNSRLFRTILNVGCYIYYCFQLVPFKFRKLPFHVVIKITGKQAWPGREQIFSHWTMQDKINYLDQIVEFSLPTFYPAWISSRTLILEEDVGYFI